MTHVIAEPEARGGVYFRVAKDHGGLDILTPDWLRECAAAGRVIDPSPRHRLHLSRCTVEAADGTMDKFGDTHSMDVDVEDVVALLQGDVAERALKSEQGRANAEGGIDEIIREMAAVTAVAASTAAAAVATTAGGDSTALRIFSGCIFLVVAMPTQPAKDGRRGGGERGQRWDGGGLGHVASVAVYEDDTPFRVAELPPVAASTVAVIPGKDPVVHASPAAALIAQNSACTTLSVTTAAAAGEVHRLARSVELSLRLRGGIIAQVPGTDITHVVAVVPAPLSNMGTAALAADNVRTSAAMKFGVPHVATSAMATATVATDLDIGGTEEDMTAPVFERALTLALRAMLPPQPPKDDYSITAALIAGDLPTLPTSTGSGGVALRGEPGGGVLPHSARVVSPTWVLACIAAGRPVVV